MAKQKHPSLHLDLGVVTRKRKRFPLKRITFVMWLLGVLCICVVFGVITFGISGSVEVNREPKVGGQANMKVDVPLMKERQIQGQIGLGLLTPTTSTTTISTTTTIKVVTIPLEDAIQTTTTLGPVRDWNNAGVSYTRSGQDSGACGGGFR